MSGPLRISASFLEHIPWRQTWGAYCLRIVRNFSKQIPVKGSHLGLLERLELLVVIFYNFYYFFPAKTNVWKKIFFWEMLAHHAINLIVSRKVDIRPPMRNSSKCQNVGNISDRLFYVEKKPFHYHQNMYVWIVNLSDQYFRKCQVANV